MAISELNGVEKQLLGVIGRGHRDRRMQVFHRGEIYCTAPFTWAELSAHVRAADDAIADAVATLVAAGAVDSVRQPTRLFRWIRRTKPATFFFVTQKGKRWSAQIEQVMVLEQN
ncbi:MULTISPECIES: hypothetical protein [Neorhizobium]|uniref:hypothetical protein n=1 Tax=Neorhizobium TaxID=1525371 RepID=UPI000CF9CF1D|nr:MULTISPECIES: hypothetical protein [unclassified Neorhizobium]